jgi:subtilisin family serine protease
MIMSVLRAASRFERGWAAIALALLLTACSGGETAPSNPNPPPAPSPPPTPTPTPTPAPTPTPTNFDTAEYRVNRGLGDIGAITAFQAGASGRGVTLAVIDSGVDPTSPEFSGRLHPLSRDIAGSRGLQDPNGHGTAVAAVAMATRNDAGMHGVAYEATLLAARTDSPGSCADDGCSHADNNIAAGVDLALQAGARVINMSLGGSSPNATLTRAMERATGQGVVIVISAGNQGRAQPDPLTQGANDPRYAGLIVIAGGADRDGSGLASFSNAAGGLAQHYILAPSVGVTAPRLNNTLFNISGTSFAAPHVAGALALLFQAFPTLSARQAVELLYSTANDLGAPGADPLYGQGMINLARAFQPQRGASLPTT